MDSIFGRQMSSDILTHKGLDALFIPAPRSGVLSAWYGHVPFAYWIINALRPRRLVELGTHNGVSYAAFCDAVSRAGLDTQCFAIDTWQGDDHAGHYGEDVYTDLRTFHDPRYAAFSELVRSTFDQALDYFQDGSIDLLHIDGCHSYEAVCHDFDHWRSKLSSRAVVLFHDTNVRERHFGVWRLWAELRLNHPSFEFMHEHGLGVLAFGSEVPDAVLELCNLSNSSDIATIRNRFAFSGRSCIIEAELERLRADAAAEKTRFNAALAECGRQIASLNQTMAERDGQITSLNQAMAERDGQITSLNQAMTERDGQITSLDQAMAERDGQIASLNQATTYTRHIEAELVRAEAERAALSADLGALLGSSAWKITGPLRNILSRRPRTSRTLRRAAKLMWWTATLQLPSRIAARRKGAEERLASAPSLPAPTFGSDEKKLFTASARAELLDFLSSGERLAVQTSENPDISVVVVLWNQAHLTLRCVRALLAQCGPSLEIVLIDNDSHDETEELLSRIDGAHVLRSATNEGFLIGCNKAVAASRGRVVLLLNSDAFVRPGALAAALAALDASPDVGAVGGKLILPSGLLQEAGSIVWSDASTQGYGRGLQPEAGEAMFRRDVDYCSGAFLMTPRSLWDRLGGFDEIFAPAYYEETDYCMRLRDLGYRIVYEPAAVIDHYEFGSEARQGDATIASRRNRKLFRTRHSNALRQRHLPPAQVNVLAARACSSSDRGRLLVIDNEVPLTALGSGYPRMRQLLAEASSLGWSVTFYPLHRPDVDWEAARSEISWEIEIASNGGAPALSSFLTERQGYFDVILVSRPDNMALVNDVLRDQPHMLDGCRLVYDAEALFCMRDITRAATEGRPLPDAEALISAEVQLANSADAIACVTVADAEVFRTHLRTTTPVYALSHPTELSANAPGFSERAGFLFVGRLLEQETPNWLGLSWFIRECWPLIRLAFPDATLSVAGHLHPDHAELEAPGVRLCGPVTDLRPLYDTARIFLAPVHFAAGIPIKILEATAAGLPTAGTRLMARQLVWTPGIEMVAEDEPAALSAAIIAMYRDAVLWNQTRTAAKERLRQEHSAETFHNSLRAILDGELYSGA